MTIKAPGPDQPASSNPNAIVGRASNGKFMKGRTGTTRTKEAARAARSLSLAIRSRLDPEVFIKFQVAIAMGKNPILVELEDGEIDVMIDERGAVTPTLEQRTQAMIRLEQRGHGMPMQQVQVDAAIANVSARAAVVPQLGDMAIVNRLAAAFAGSSLPAPSSSSGAPALDVESTDSTSKDHAPASRDVGTGAPASTDLGRDAG